MVIAINTVVATGHGRETPGNFIGETIQILAAGHPEHRFVLMVPDASREPGGGPQNIRYISVGQLPTGVVKRYILFPIKINSILKKIKADLFISAGAGPAASKVPQCIILPDLNGVLHPEGFRAAALHFYKRSLNSQFSEAKVVITFSGFIKEEVIKHFSVAAPVINIVPCGIDPGLAILPVSIREEVKSRYSGGHEYFLYTGWISPHQNLVNLLKAFSQFKKRQKSGMKMLLAGNPGWHYTTFAKDLQLYKYRADVELLTELKQEELVLVTASAYAMVYPAVREGFATEPLRAMKSGVPVIAASSGAMEEILGEAALYFDPANVQEMASQMMQVYRDEDLRTGLISKGRAQAAPYTWEAAAKGFWEALQPWVI